MWNEANLTIPPFVTIKVSDVTFVKEVQSLFGQRKNLLFDYLQDELASTAALLSRLMARRKTSFRNMIAFKFVCKLNTALSRILKVDVEQALSNFYQMLPDSSSYHHNEVPSRSNFDYILTRLISVHKIFQRIVHCCQESVKHFNSILINNFFMDAITLFLAVIAKTWDLANKLGNAYSEFYAKLVAFRKYFPQKNVQNIFKNVDFSSELVRFSTKPISTVKDSPDNQSQTNNIIMIKEPVQAAPIAFVNVIPKLKKEEDFGMPISRESMKPVIDLSRIHNIDDIRQFFKEENEKRSKALDTCATKYILKHEWLAIQKLVERKIIANDHKKALSVFRKFITSKT